MKAAVMQPYLFPYFGYWQLVAAADVFVIYDDVNYIARGFVNRNTVLVNNRPWRFTLQIEKCSPNKRINELNTGDNAAGILETIERAYKKSPFFSEAFPIIECCLLHTERSLAKFLTFSITQVCAFLEIETPVVVSSALDKNPALKGQARIIEICGAVGADEYVNLPGGKSLYDREAFLQEGIQLHFIEPCAPVYRQFSGDFVPNLSIIDCMMFLSRESLIDCLENYTLE